jgi:hypothetical protein
MKNTDASNKSNEYSSIKLLQYYSNFIFYLFEFLKLTNIGIGINIFPPLNATAPVRVASVIMCPFIYNLINNFIVFLIGINPIYHPIITMV